MKRLLNAYNRTCLNSVLGQINLIRHGILDQINHDQLIIGKLLKETSTMTQKPACERPLNDPPHRSRF